MLNHNPNTGEAKNRQIPEASGAASLANELQVQWDCLKERTLEEILSSFSVLALKTLLLCMAPISQSSHKGSSVFTHASQVLLLPNHMLAPVFNETEKLLERMWNRNIVLSFRNSICYTPNEVISKAKQQCSSREKKVYLGAVFIGKPREIIICSRPIQVHQSMRTKNLVTKQQ